MKWKLKDRIFWATLLCVACSGDSEPQSPPEPTSVVAQDETIVPNQLDVALAEIVATCAHVSGEVEVRRKGEAHWTAVQVGATFHAGDWVRTNEDSSARVQFLASGALDLEANTTIIVDVSSGDAEHPATSPIIALESGVATGVMNRVGTEEVRARPLLVRKDGRVVSLRAATDEVKYRLSKTDEGTEIAVTDGELAVMKEDGSAVEVKDGRRVEVRRNGLGPIARMIGFPVSLAPGVDARFLYKEGSPIKLRWKRVKKAKSYRLQVARDLSFQSLVIDKVATGTESVFVPPSVGVYAWRIAARDKNDQYGEYGFTRRIFSEADAPRDLLLSPADGSKIAYEDTAPSISFSWQSAGETKSYLLVIGHGTNPLNNVEFKTRVSTQVYLSNKLKAGNYTWGVYIGEDNEPIFLNPRRLTIQKRIAPKTNADGIWD